MSAFWTRQFRAMHGRRGQITVLVALTLVIMVGIAGLAIDSGRAYGVKAKLNGAVDAASLAAARALAEGDSDAARIDNARSAAARYFAANFPDDYLGAVPGTPQTQIEHETSGYWRVTVSGTAAMPVTLLAVLPSVQSPVSVAAVGQAIRRDVDVMLVLDVSGSLGPPTSPSNTLAKLKSAAINGFVSHFSAAPGGDRVGLVSFASGAVLDVPINKTSARGFVRSNSAHTGVADRIQALTIGGSTAQAEGLRRAHVELNQIPVQLRSSLRVILLFSDGAPNDVSAQFQRTAGPGNQTVTGDLYSETEGPATARANRVYYADRRDTQLGTYNDIAQLPGTGIGGVPLAGVRNLGGPAPFANTRCNVNRAARNMVENVAQQARSEGILVYTVGLGARLDSLEISFCGYGNTERGGNILRRVANDLGSDLLNPSAPVGRYCHAADADALAACFSDIASEVLRLTM
jgi:Flp pilus assembly protein TadG